MKTWKDDIGRYKRLEAAFENAATPQEMRVEYGQFKEHARDMLRTLNQLATLYEQQELALASQIDITNALRQHCNAVEKTNAALRASGGKIVSELYGISPVSPAALDSFVTSMRDEVIPAVEKTLQEREEARIANHHRPVS